MYKMMIKDAEYMGDGRWICAEANQKSLYLFDEDTEEMSFAVNVNVEGVEEFGTHISYIIKRNDSIYMFKYCGVNVYKFDPVSNSFFEEAGLIEPQIYNDVKTLLGENDCVWFVPRKAEMGIFGYDLKNESWKELTALTEWKKGKGLSDDLQLAFVPTIMKDRIWSCIFGGSSFFSIDTKSDSIKEYSIPGCSIGGLYQNGDFLWLRRKDRIALIRYEMKSGCYKEFVFDTAERKVNPTYNLIDVGSYIILLPMAENRLIMFDKTDEKFKVMYEEERESFSDGPLWIGFRIMGSAIYLFPNFSTNIVIIDIDERIVRKVIRVNAPFEYQSFMADKRYGSTIWGGSVIRENMKLNLEQYLYGISYR